MELRANLAQKKVTIFEVESAYFSFWKNQSFIWMKNTPAIRILFCRMRAQKVLSQVNYVLEFQQKIWTLFGAHWRSLGLLDAPWAFGRSFGFSTLLGSLAHFEAHWRFYTLPGASWHFWSSSLQMTWVAQILTNILAALFSKNLIMLCLQTKWKSEVGTMKD